MKTWMNAAIAHLRSLLQNLQFRQAVAVMVIGFWLLTSGMDIRNAEGQAPRLTQKIQQEIHTKDSDRPKTTGEFLDEARGDVPLDERIDNIVRDSKEAFQDWGEEYAKGIRKTGDQIQEGVEQIREDIVDAVQ